MDFALSLYLAKELVLNSLVIYQLGFFFLSELVRFKTIDEVMVKSWVISIILSCLGSTTIIFIGAIARYIVIRFELSLTMGQVILSNPFYLILTILLADFITFAFHYIYHRVDIFWSFHLVHHVETRVTSISAYRFHPLENILWPFCNFFLGSLFGIPYSASLLHVMIIQFYSHYVHSRIFLPKKVESVLNLLIVTPRFHHVHHEKRLEKAYNFGLGFTIWDRIFGTYKAFQDVEHISYGVKGIDEESSNKVWRNLFFKFKYKEE